MAIGRRSPKASAQADIRSRLRIPVEKLTTSIDERALGFASTREVGPLEATIGQERALRALEFGLGVKAPGFNVFVAGLTGSGRNTTLSSYLQRIAAGRPTADDWVYVHNFEDPQKPDALRLPAGMGRDLRRDMEELLEDARRVIPSVLEGDEYQRRIHEGQRDVQERRRKLADALSEEAKNRGFGLALTNGGLILTPLSEGGQQLEREQFEALPAERQA